MNRRKLTPAEQQEAFQVFQYSVDYQRITIHEEVRWPNLLGRIGARLRGEKPPAANAVTLLNHIFFPRLLPDMEGLADSSRALADMGWLIHELTHVWQYQNRGLGYVLGTVWLHLKARADIYGYGGAVGLREQTRHGAGIFSFNAEQQGDIVRDYYLRFKRDQDSAPWLPYIEELRKYLR